MELLYLIGGMAALYFLLYGIVFIVISIKEYFSNIKNTQIYKAKLKQLEPVFNKTDLKLWESTFQKYSADFTSFEQKIESKQYIQNAQNISAAKLIVNILDNKRV